MDNNDKKGKGMYHKEAMKFTLTPQEAEVRQALWYKYYGEAMSKEQVEAIDTLRKGLDEHVEKASKKDAYLDTINFLGESNQDTLSRSMNFSTLYEMGRVSRWSRFKFFIHRISLYLSNIFKV